MEQHGRCGSISHIFKQKLGRHKKPITDERAYVNHLEFLYGCLIFSRTCYNVFKHFIELQEELPYGLITGDA